MIGLLRSSSKENNKRGWEKPNEVSEIEQATNGLMLNRSY